MKRRKHIKVAITGAAGQISYALLFRIASGEMFGPEVEIDLHLLELLPVLPALEGVKMELEDCAFPLLRQIVCTSDVSIAMQDVNWGILLGAAPRISSQMERADLLKINAGIFLEQGRAIDKHAAKDVRVLVVGNPCNTNCMIAMHQATRVPKEHFFAMTMLDQNRSIIQLAMKANVPVTNVDNMIVWGNHSATQFPDFYHAKINEKLAMEVIIEQDWFKTYFLSAIQKRGAEIIQARGKSSAASAANAVIDTVKFILGHSNTQQYFSLAKCSNGEYGVDPGLIFSFPCYLDDDNVRVFDSVKHDADAQQYIHRTLNELREERDLVSAMGFLE